MAAGLSPSAVAREATLRASAARSWVVGEISRECLGFGIGGSSFSGPFLLADNAEGTFFSAKSP